MNKTLNDIKLKAKRLWDENPVIVVVLGIATANASAKMMQANTDRKREKTWRKEVARRDRIQK